MKDPKLLARGAAARAGLDTRTWNIYVKRGAAPEPDGREPVSGTPWWWGTTVDAWQAAGRRAAHRPRKDAANG